MLGSNVAHLSRSLTMQYSFPLAHSHSQVLANLQALISELLPHEITRVIGQQLSLAAHTAVIFPRQEMYDKYLRPWGGSVRRLVAEAAEAEGLSGSIETLSDSERYRAVAFHISKPFNRTMPYADLGREQPRGHPQPHDATQGARISQQRCMSASVVGRSCRGPLLPFDCSLPLSSTLEYLARMLLISLVH